ncbi:acyl-CoA dehydrogenase family protein [Nocardioides campestrisoli]|uniref:acyl-CoA dehydrogenase family protein n=1 Tax=Nocardioides campestrisoli TaxID=2736757 RepID=UPI00163D8C04|nr:acyl-CoA dehydrogenase family protein [Nocardioides campestrisoli]
MDFSLSDEQIAVRDTVRRFLAREVLPLEGEVLHRERHGETGLRHDELVELREKARTFGFWGLGTPVEHGGMGLDAVTQSLVWTELGKTFVPFSFGGEADNILFHADAAQQAEYLIPTIEGTRRSCFAITEPGAGSDAANIRMRAVRDGDSWVLNGEKTFITGGHEADFAIVVAVTDPEQDVRRGGATAFLVDRELGWTSSPIATMGEASPATLVFEDVRVPADKVLGEVGQGFALGMQWIGRGRYIIPSFATGVAERALQMAIGQATTRHTFGRPIGDNQAIAWMIADCEADLEAARWLTLRAAWAVDHDLDVAHASSLAKLTGSLMVNRVVDRVMQIHGGLGYTKELPIEKWYRQVRLFRIFEGTDEMQRLIISRDLLRGYTRVGAHLA